MKIIPYRPDLNQEYYNPFKEKGIYPFCEIGRCITNSGDGTIKRWCHELDSNLDVDGNDINLNKENEDVMVYIPAFYHKRVWEGDVLKDSILTRVPDTVEYEGYKVHQAFIKKDGTIRKYILVGAFNSVRSFNYNNKRSAGSTPGTQTDSYFTIQNAIDKIRKERNNNFFCLDITSLNAIQILAKIAFTDLNLPKILGPARGESYGDTKGITMTLGNRSGLINNCVSTLGIEDLYGSSYEYIAGILIKKNKIYYTKDFEDFLNIEKSIEFEFNISKTTQGLRSIQKIENSEFNFLNLPDQLSPQYHYYYSTIKNTRNDSDDFYSSIKVSGNIFSLTTEGVDHSNERPLFINFRLLFAEQ